MLVGAYMYLDLTPKGRNETGPRRNLTDWVRHHDRYDADGTVNHQGRYIACSVRGFLVRLRQRPPVSALQCLVAENPISSERLRALVDDVYRADSRRVLATLIRLLGDFELAEEALHEAFLAAVEQWPRDGVPGNPRAWLVSAGRFKAIDALRKRARFDASLVQFARQFDAALHLPLRS